MQTLTSALLSLIVRLGVCAVVGGVVGSLAGTVIGLVQHERPDEGFSAWELVVAALMTGLVGWVLVLLVVGAWHRYGVREIGFQALVTSLVVAFLTVWINDLVKQPSVAGLIGLVIGLAVGAALCVLCSGLIRTSARAAVGERRYE